MLNSLKKYIFLTFLFFSFLGINVYAATHTADSSDDMWIEYMGGTYCYKDSSLVPYGYDDSYFIYNGPVKSGWIKYQDKWYYLNEDGTKKTGWLDDNGKWYYLYKTGAMAEDVQIDFWYVGKDGIWDGITQPEAKKMEATIKTEKDVYESGVTEIKYTLNNNLVDQLVLGDDCVLEKYENENWSIAPTKKELSFYDVCIGYEPCTSYSETLDLEPYENLTPGLYRINYEGMYSEFYVQ